MATPLAQLLRFLAVCHPRAYRNLSEKGRPSNREQALPAHLRYASSALQRLGPSLRTCIPERPQIMRLHKCALSMAKPFEMI